MKRKLLLPLFTVITAFGLQAQVTQINSNKSLQFNFPFSNNKAIFVSGIDQTLWATDATAGGTIQLSPDILFEDYLGVLSGKYIFIGSTTATGIELYITDGTVAGTTLVKDINPGPTGSNANTLGILNGFGYFTAETPTEGNELWKTDGTLAGTTLVKDINPGTAGSFIGNDVDVVNNIIFFTAERPAEGRELWRSDGTNAGTTLIKDIVPGTGGSNYVDKYDILSTGTYVLFMARTPASGVELWKSDGTEAGTVLLKDINTGADSSNARSFYILNNVVLFAATNAATGDEIWRTDGTAVGTTVLKDINPGTGSSTEFEIVPGFGSPVFFGFHRFNNKVFFNAYNGTSTGQVWSTDGSSVNTSLLKDIVPGTSLFSVMVTSAINLANKFIFPVAEQTSGRSELWESDGTVGGTNLFMSFAPASPATTPTILAPFSLTGGPAPLFQGNKFFFTASPVASGNELWVSDGTIANTNMVKDINPGTPHGISSTSFLYTSTALFFTANNGTNGRELWRSDGTLAGTVMVQDINPGVPTSSPSIVFMIINGKILVQATNGDNSESDLYAVDGNYIPLPVSLTMFTVMPGSADATLNWRISQQLNSKDFTVQRSYDGVNFENIGKVAAVGTSTTVHAYSFIDAGVMSSGKTTVYYRLLSTDLDGKSAFSPIITLKLKGIGKWNVRLLSNPIGENIKLILSGISEKVQLSVVDMSGKKWLTNSLSAVNGQISLPAASLPQGSYMLLTESGNERKIIQFVK